MKITKNELKEIIREEAIKFKRKIELENELSEVQSQLDEVHAGKLHTPSDSAGPMFEPEFDKVPNKFGAAGETHTYMEEEVVAEDDDMEINIAAEESYLSEEALEEMLSEIMSEDDDEYEGEQEEPEGEPAEGEPVEESMMEDDEETKLQGKETPMMKKAKLERARKLKSLGKTDIYDSLAQEVLNFIPAGQELDVAKLKTAIDKRKKVADAKGDAEGDAEGGAQPQNESASLVSEEVERMRELAGIKIL